MKIDPDVLAPASEAIADQIRRTIPCPSKDTLEVVGALSLLLAEAVRLTGLNFEIIVEATRMIFDAMPEDEALAAWMASEKLLS